MRVRAVERPKYMSTLRSSYTLSETAKLLAMDVKTLRAKLHLFNISPVRSKSDARARLLTREQIDMLVRRLAEVESEASISSRLSRANATSPEGSLVEFEETQQRFAESVERLGMIVEKLNHALSPALDRLIALDQGDHARNGQPPAAPVSTPNGNVSARAKHRDPVG